MNKSMTAAILVIFAGYTVASYGYVLLRGWDIPFKAWVDPLDAYRWPASGLPGPIPPGQVFPSQTSLASYATIGGNSTAGTQQQQAGIAANQGRSTNPVQSRL